MVGYKKIQTANYSPNFWNYLTTPANKSGASKIKIKYNAPLKTGHFY